LNRKSIEERPVEINERQRLGDWERDLMFGASRRSALLTLVERKTLLTQIRKVESKSPREIARATSRVFAQPMLICRSMTNDNGIEFRNHEAESKQLNIPIYFTHPYASWERGSIENTNGLIRQYFKAETDMGKFTDEDAQKIEEALNYRPRKKLGFRTPEECFFERKIALFS
jgi:IS30 family transposase